MRLERRQSIDCFRWRCHTRGCRQTLSVRKGTIFEDFRSDVGRLAIAIYFWSMQMTGVDISRITGLNKNIVSQLRRKLRRCCRNDLRRNPIRIDGGGNWTVQIDESTFHHRQRANRGRRARRQIWVFGMVDTRYTPARALLQVVPNRGRRTLIPIINRVLAGQNVRIHSDMWRAYINLPNFVPNCLTHETVNHSRNFVDPVTGAHTQHIESCWNRVKYQLKKRKGCRRNRLQSYLNEFMWMDWRGGNNRFDAIARAIAIDFPQ